MLTERRNARRSGGARPPGTSGRYLFWVTCLIAGLLAAVVVLAPFCDAGEPAPDGWDRLVALFARDVTLRRTCLASAAGLVVSACVFFQPAAPASPAASEAPRRPRSSGVAGA